MQLADVLADTDVLGHLDAAHDAAWALVDRELLGCCRDRMAMLLGHRPTLDGMDDACRQKLADWPTSPEVSDTQRACLALVEHYLLDVASVPDELVAAVRDALGDQGLADLVSAILVVEQRMRLELIWEALL